MSDMRRRKFIALFGAIMTALAAEVCVERAHAYTTPLSSAFTVKCCSLNPRAARGTMPGFSDNAVGRHLLLVPVQSAFAKRARAAACSRCIAENFRHLKEEAMKQVAVTAALLGGLCVFLIPPAYAAEGHTFVTGSDLQWGDVPALPPGAKIAVIEGPLTEAVPFTFRIKLPADFKIPAHSHPSIEHVTVISGTFNIGMGDKLDPSKTQAIPAGGVAIMQPKMNHFAWTKEETILQVHGVGPWAVNYVDPADDPRKK